MAPHADTWHKAGWVIQDPDTIIRDGIVHVSRGRIISANPHRPIGTDQLVDHGAGVLMPALVNAHTHLELSALKGKIPHCEGFEMWVRHLIEKRAGLDDETLLTGIQAGIDEVIQSGCGMVAEIATAGLSGPPFLASHLNGIWFKEYLGNLPDECSLVLDSKKTSFAGHAPHTTAPSLLTKLKRFTLQHGRPFSIHLSESDQEVAFIRSGKGPWAGLLKERNIDFSNWPLPARSPVDYLDRLNIFDKMTLAVHLLQVDPHDIDILAKHGVSVAVCPRSNRRLHARQPAIPEMMERGLNICLGTDSLASCDSLSVFDEMAWISQNYPMLSPEQILSMATINGADALCLGADYGRLAPGYRFSAAYVPLKAASPKTLSEGIVNNAFNGNVKLISDE